MSVEFVVIAGSRRGLRLAHTRARGRSQHFV